MRRLNMLLTVLAGGPLLLLYLLTQETWLSRSAQAQAPIPINNSNVPRLPLEVVPDFLKYAPTMNLGETLGVAVNSKGEIVVLNHPGSPTSGPLYGNATTQLLVFDRSGKFVREIGQGVYGLGYAHAVRFDRYDNLWVVDKGTNSVMKFNPAGYVTMNLGRRPEGYEGEYHRPEPPKAVPVDGLFNGPTDIGWDAQDNIYVSEGYVNNRIAKFDKNGNWVKTWGQYGEGGEHANLNPGHFRNVHTMQIDRQGNIYAGDRGNRRIHVFDSDGRFLRFLHMNVPYDKARHPVLGNLPTNRPDETAPWTMCMTNGPTQYLFVMDSEPGRLYKMTLDGKIVGVYGESGRQTGQFNWPHGLACPSENELYVADMNNWRIVKLVTSQRTTTSSR
ncbi:MAG: peptidyl-alpha-hydroxyglycine alpha-amidating lyase family protein [Vicinamibacterales bacterium]